MMMHDCALIDVGLLLDVDFGFILFNKLDSGTSSKSYFILQWNGSKCSHYSSPDVVLDSDFIKVEKIKIGSV